MQVIYETPSGSNTFGKVLSFDGSIVQGLGRSKADITFSNIAKGAVPGNSECNGTIVRLVGLSDLAKAKFAILEFRRQKIEWIKELQGYIDIDPNIPIRGGKYLLRADNALKNAWGDSSITKATLATIATNAARGALDITDVKTWAANISSYPDPTGNVTLWVDKSGNRVNLASSVDYGAAETNYNGFDETWLV